MRSFRSISTTISCLVLVCLLIIQTSAADETLLKDVAVLSNGSQVTGKITETEIDGKRMVIIEMENGMKMTVRRSQVSQLRMASERLAAYQTEKLKMTDDLAGHWAMAAWCKANIETGVGGGKLSPQREYHLQKVIRFDPNHSGARKLLGYTQSNGQWIHREHMKSQHGMIKIGSRWYTKQEIMLKEANDQSDAKYKWWKIELKKQRNRPTKLSEYQNTLRTIQEKFAVDGLIDLYKSEKIVGLKDLTIEAIGRLDSSRARNFLVDTAILDPNERYRERAMSLLNGKHFSKYYAASRASQIMLKTKDNPTVNRAAYVIGQMRQENALLPLIKSLKTTHKFVYDPGAEMQMTFSNQGTGFRPGQKKQVITRTFENAEVLSALRIISNQNYDFNEQAWLAWYTQKFTVDSTDLRRDR